MFILLIIVAVLQATFLPGFLLSKYFLKENDVFRLFTFSFSLSACVSYLLVYFLVIIDFFTQETLITIFVLELLLLFPVIKKMQFPKLPQFMPLNFFRKGYLNITLNANFFINTTVFLFFLLSFKIVFSSLFDTFAWDGLVSWNRWALEFLDGVFPDGYGPYPQLVPTVFATLYRIMDANIHTVAIFSGSFYFFFVLTALFSLLNKKNALPIFIVALICFFWHEKYAYVGYVDFPVMSMVIFSAVALYHFIEGNEIKYFMLSIILAAFACVTKQAGLLWFPFVFVIAFFANKKLFLEAIKLKKMYFVWLVVFVVIFSEIFRLCSSNAFERIAPMVYTLTEDIHVGQGYLDRFLESLTFNYWLTGCYILSIPVLFSKKYRFWALAGIVYFTVWAVFLSYDIRNMSVAVPFIALSSGILFQYIFCSTYERLVSIFYEKNSLLLKNIYILFSSIIILSLSFTIYIYKNYGKSEIIYLDNEKIMRTGGYELNATILEFLDRTNLPLVATYYSFLGSLPQFKEKNITFFYIDPNPSKDKISQVRNAANNLKPFVFLYNKEYLKDEIYKIFPKSELVEHVSIFPYSLCVYDPDKTANINYFKTIYNTVPLIKENSKESEKGFFKFQNYKYRMRAGKGKAVEAIFEAQDSLSFSLNIEFLLDKAQTFYCFFRKGNVNLEISAPDIDEKIKIKAGENKKFDIILNKYDKLFISLDDNNEYSICDEISVQFSPLQRDK